MRLRLLLMNKAVETRLLTSDPETHRKSIQTTGETLGNAEHFRIFVGFGIRSAFFFGDLIISCDFDLLD